jgi:hypothetical protein
MRKIAIREWGRVIANFALVSDSSAFMYAQTQPSARFGRDVIIID